MGIFKPFQLTRNVPWPPFEMLLLQAAELFAIPTNLIKRPNASNDVYNYINGN